MQTNKKKALFFTVIILVLFIGLFSWASYVKKQDQKAVQETALTASTTLTQYSMADISTHNNSTSCWTSIDGLVYDLTPFAGKHPGGENPILKTCGVDGTAMYNQAHKGSARKKAEIQNYIVGALKK